MTVTEGCTWVAFLFLVTNNRCKAAHQLLLKVPDELNALGMLPKSPLDDTSKMRMTGNSLLLLGREPLQQQDDKFSSFGQLTD